MDDLINTSFEIYLIFATVKYFSRTYVKFPLSSYSFWENKALALVILLYHNLFLVS